MKPEYTPLMRAILINAQRAALQEINATRNLNKRSSVGFTALHYATLSRIPFIITWLVDAGANVNRGQHKRSLGIVHTGYRPLHMALEHGHFDAARELLVAGAVVDDDRYSILHCLLTSPRQVSKNEEDLVMCLIGLGARLQAADSRGQTPLDRALDQHNDYLVALLRAQGAELRNLELESDDELECYGDSPPAPLSWRKTEAFRSP